MPTIKVKNKRQSERKDCFVPVDGKTGGPFSAVKTINFSKGGLGFISYRKIPLNKQIPIEIDLHGDKEPVLVIGKVKWVRPIENVNGGAYRIGVVFGDILQGSQSRLNKYFRKSR